MADRFGPLATANIVESSHEDTGPRTLMTDTWAAAQRLLGRWEGPATGRPGRGDQVREYRLILGSSFILGTNETRWDPTPDEPEGSLHEDLSVLGLDRAAGQLVMRAFFSEGFAHDYRCVAFDAAAPRFIFEATQVENGPPGMRARETIELTGADELDSTFEVAMPGGGFEPYTLERLRRTGG